MIETYFTNPNAKKPTRYISPYIVDKAKEKNCKPEEYQDRQDAIYEASKGLAMWTGDTVYPRTAKGFEDYGECKIVGICRNYADYGHEWPASGVPMVVSAYSKKNQTDFICTANFLVKTKPNYEPLPNASSNSPTC